MATAAAFVLKQPGATNGIAHIPTGMEDPFISEAMNRQSQPPPPPRVSSIENQMSGLNASSSPSQAKCAIEAHLVETDRRLQDAGRLGSTLVQQREALVAKLDEVEKRKDDTELPPGLRETLAEIEREYDDVGRETARALLASRSRTVNPDHQGAESSPAVFSSHTNVSPSKASAAARKQRNQPTSRAGDVQFAADISSSLLVQVRQLQSALAERDESLKSATTEKSRLEREAEGFTHRLRALDESEQRYKDENWNLETQTHEMMAAAREATDREKKLNASLASTLAEKGRIANDLDDIRVSHGKLNEDHTAARKIHDSELHSLRRNLDMADHERDVLQRQMDEMTSQNQELANAIANQSRSRDNVDGGDLNSGPEDESKDAATPENSPPPSPIKATPRHGALETETLKSSLHHAHRMIQNLKGNIHREKTEKIELKRMLQDARDEVEQRRADSGALGSGSKRQRTKPEPFKRPARPDMLGGSRRTRTDVEVDEPDWEDHAAEGSPSRTVDSRYGTATSDADHTATEAEGAFETANERESTGSEDFQTGAESLAGESTDESTETETGGLPGRWNTIRAGRSSIRGNVAANRSSYLSTASTSAGEDEMDSVQAMSSQPLRYRLKLGRGTTARRSYNAVDTPPSQSLVGARDSPASWGSSPPSAEQNLFAELGELNGGGSEFSTPGRASLLSSRSTPATAQTSGRQVSSAEPRQPVPAARTATMVDQGTMTETWQPETPSRNRVGAPSPFDTSSAPRHRLQGHGLSPASPSDFPLPPSTTTSPSKSELQHTPLRGMQESPLRGGPNFITPPKTIWDEAQDQEAMALGEKGIPSSPPVPSCGLLQRETTPNKISNFVGADPVASWSFSPLMTQETIPIEPATSAIALSAPSPSASEQQSPAPAQATVAGAAALVLGSVGTALGFSAGKRAEGAVAEETRGQSRHDRNSESQRDSSLSTQDGAFHADRRIVEDADPTSVPSTFVPTSDQGSQTALTAEQIDSALRKITPKSSQGPGPLQPPTLRPTVTSGDSHPASRNRMPVVDPDLPPQSPLRRSGSATSQQATNAAQHPPLPLDHKNVITKARGRVSTSGAEPAQPPITVGSKVMGTPVAPPSAYRPPRTPVDQGISSPTRGSTTPRAGPQDRLRAGSQRSRRSSVSSFASELDERFNMRADGPPVNRSFDAGPETDPHMIQAITQTMIGEFLWKYTRKRGRPEMSNTRHRRYFWVHPYTRTLYWSEQDPQSAGGKELKAKSVAIESVSVVTDDNHMPPGLHGKSLEVVTPGRRIRFTAGTGNRHETWFNALSYLLMRGQDDAASGNGGAGSNVDGDGLTSADVDEFNPTPYTRNSRLGVRTTSRASLSSYHSHTTRGTTHSRASYARSSVQTGGAGPSRASSAAPGSHAVARTISATPTSNADHDPRPPPRQGSVSRLSNMFRPSSIRNSFSTNPRRGSVRHSDNAGGGGGAGGTITSRSAANTKANSSSIYNASIVSAGERDSGEEMRRELSRHERSGQGKLENVRACCDGKHDVSDLANHNTVSHRHSRSGRDSTSNSTATLSARSSRHRSRDRWASSVSSRVRL